MEVVSVEGLEATYGNLLELLESAEAVCETWMLKKKPKCRFISFSISPNFKITMISFFI